MALASPVYVGENTIGSTDAVTISAVAPTQGHLAILVTGSSKATTPSAAPTISGTNWANVTWTQIGTDTNGGIRITVFYATVGAGGSGDVTATFDATNSVLAAQLFTINSDGGTPEFPSGQVGTANGGPGSSSFSADMGTPDAAGMVLGCVWHIPGTATSYTPGTGYTETRTTNGSDQVYIFSEYDNPGPSDGIADATADNGGRYAMVAFEIREPAAATLTDEAGESGIVQRPPDIDATERTVTIYAQRERAA